MALKPNIVTHHQSEIPRGNRGYSLPPPLPAGPQKRVNRNNECSFSFGVADSQTMRRSLTPAQLKAADIQQGHKQCGIPKRHASETPAPPLKGFKEWDVRRVEVPQAALTAGKKTPTPAAGGDASSAGGADDDVPLERLVDHPWELPRVDVKKQRDPYLRAQGLHKNDVFLMSHMMKRMMAARDFSSRPSVDFNFKYTDY